MITIIRNMYYKDVIDMIDVCEKNNVKYDVEIREGHYLYIFNDITFKFDTDEEAITFKLTYL